MTSSRLSIGLILGIALLLGGCAPGMGNVPDRARPMMAAAELADSELLDVTISVFDSAELSEKEKTRLGLSEDIRRAEERFMPVHLKYTMQRSGYWGAVRVVPGEGNADVRVEGTIRYSDGEHLALKIRATDARGVPWFEKTYSENVTPADYAGIVPEKKDAFQDTYTTIANDLVVYRNQLTAEELQNIRRVAELRFAAEMAPDAFAGDLEQDGEGHYRLRRLPAEDDPMLRRIRAVRGRDAMLVDTINDYYDAYYRDLWQPYADWRLEHGREVAAMREVEKEALTRKLLGIAAIAGGVLLSTRDNSLGNSSLPDVMIMGGAAAVYSGFQRSKDTAINRDAIAELSASFSAEAEPLVVEVEGETVRLTGSAEEQYAQWRSLLRTIYGSETGLPVTSDADREKTLTDSDAHQATEKAVRNGDEEFEP